jgi:S-adenosylmethionine-diacylgycerolhomoserine-N-methlytransferase
MNSHIDTTTGHGAAMDRMYRLQRHIYDLTRRYYLLGRDHMLDELKASPQHSILEIGCGTGRNLIGAAKRYPLSQYFGIDISNEMLKSAEKSLALAGLLSKTLLAQGDATNFDADVKLGRKRFDRIYFSYTLSMVPQWQMALRHATTLLAEDGELHIVDFGQCEKWPSPFKRLLFKWLDLFHVSPRSELPTVLMKLADELKLDLISKKDFGGYACRFVLRHS